MNKADLTRWSWVEIDRGALRRNTRAYKNLLNPRQRLCCVVKADAYGHGAVECAKIMYSAGADMFAVATVNEGVELRQGGITKPILILSEPPIEAIPTLLEFDIMPSVYTSDFALAYGECAVAAGKVGKYHLAIETGMNRIGVHYTQGSTLSAVLISIAVFSATAYLRTSPRPMNLRAGTTSCSVSALPRPFKPLRMRVLSAVSCTAPTRRPRCSTPRCILI